MPIPAAVVAAGIAGGSSLLGGVLGNNSRRKAQAAQRAHEIDMFNRTNAYNTPLAQRERLETAGYNPALMYGQMGSHTASSIAPKQLEPPSYEFIGQAVNSALSVFMDYVMADKKLQLMEADIALKEQKTHESQFGMDMTSFKTPYELENLVSRTALNFSNKNKIDTLLPSQLDLNQRSISKLDKENDRLAIEISQMPEKHQAAMRESASRIAEASSRMSLQEVQRLIQEEELELRKLGLSYGDDLLARVAAKAASDIQNASKIREAGARAAKQGANSGGFKQFKNR